MMKKLLKYLHVIWRIQFDDDEERRIYETDLAYLHEINKTKVLEESRNKPKGYLWLKKIRPNFNLLEKMKDGITNNYNYEFNNLLLNNQNNSNSLALLGDFNFLGLGIGINKSKAFKLYQKATDLGNSSGMCSLGYC
ncbi:hypothetical protein RhiirA1_461716 [Rhizophagus irregularis]|uniref:Uncharacterized protein n=1 Tax=Rhizophagus irregularis TaxID=588596 RepID=A0A2N0RNP4_9GLOM|nr:hypothetical protein RhiirA1_461716 [Rhizophagus irregularis]